MKTAIELVDELSRPVRVNGLCLEAAAMLRQQAKENDRLQADLTTQAEINAAVTQLARKNAVERDALKADAERYRWLRRNPTYLGWDADFEAEFVDFEVDKAIDAMKGKS